MSQGVVILRKLVLSSVAVTAVLLAGCGSSSDEAEPSDSYSMAPAPSAPVPTSSANIIDPDAANLYRTALEASLAAQSANGLTEIWKDGDGNLAQVVAFDQSTNKAAQHDVIGDTAQELDAAAMMPNVLLDELDALEGNAATDVGSVTSQKKGTFTVLNHIDDSKYVSVYTVDAQNRISSAEVYVDDELSATAKFVYEVTQEGKTALAKLG